VTSRQGLKGLFWIFGGTVALIIVLALLAIHYHREEDIAAKATYQARRLGLVEQMRAALSSASEAEKSAVMATTDQESQAFADQSRAASTVVERTRDDLGKLLEASGTREERDLLSEFSLALAECQHIDRELLDLAVKNTNLKAYDLTFGPAANALASMDGALSHILSESAATAAPEARQVMLLAAGAQSGAWRIQALLPPHIFEENDERMDELEARMAREDQKIRSDLKGLAAPLGSESLDLDAAVSSYAQFTELKTRILELSRQNTNVRSLILSLNQKRKAVQVCQDALTALGQTIQEEPLTDHVPESPR
jgi:hypothetical protein